MVRAIERAESVGELAHARATFPHLVRGLIRRGASADHIGVLLAHANDQLTRRLLQIAGRELGPAPTSFCWLVMGSQARCEQTLHTDQDNGLIYADGAPATAEAYFAQLAEWMAASLDECGVPRCPGNLMAVNPVWRGPLAAWRARFGEWIYEPEPEALLRVLSGFDFRAVANEDSQGLAQDLRDWLLTCTPGARRFLAHIAGAALASGAPLGWLRGFALPRIGADAGLLDLKLRALRPIVDSARLLALAQGVRRTPTLERLAAAAAVGAISSQNAREAHAAFVAIQSLRFQLQLAALETGQPLTNLVAPSSLPTVEQAWLRQQLRALGRLQDALRRRYAIELMGV